MSNVFFGFCHPPRQLLLAASSRILVLRVRVHVEASVEEVRGTRTALRERVVANRVDGDRQSCLVEVAVAGEEEYNANDGKKDAAEERAEEDEQEACRGRSKSECEENGRNVK